MDLIALQRFCSCHFFSSANDNAPAKEDLLADDICFLLGIHELFILLPFVPLDQCSKSFANYDFIRIHGQDADALKNLSVLSEVYSGTKNAFIGPPGVRKAHLTEAYGRKCCEQRQKAFEFNEKFITARKDGG